MVGKPKNKNEYQAIREELLHLPKDTMEAIMNYAFQDKYDQLLVDVETTDMYRNWNKLSVER